MSTAEIRTGAEPGTFFDESIGKKVVMAATGVILFGFVGGHLMGNLQVFLGPDVFNAYGQFLRENPALVWGTRVTVLISVVLHIWSSVQLTALKRSARPVAYSTWSAKDSDYASRTMMMSGPIIAGFVVYHLMHLTFGTLHPSFDHTDIYHNLVVGLSSPPVALAYIVAVVMLGMHLRHGLWSMFQTLGLTNPRYLPKLKTLAGLVAAALILGYISIPVGILTGVVG